LTASVEIVNGTGCTVSSDPGLSDLPVTVPCTTGFNVSVTVPKSNGEQISYKLRLVARSTTSQSSRSLIVIQEARGKPVCSYFGPGADLRHCDLNGVDLIDADLARADMIDTNLQNADLYGANLNRADLKGALLPLVESGNIVGTPKVLPSGWELTDGYLVGYAANLSDADLAGANLAGLNLTNADFDTADLLNANLSGAVLTGAMWYDTICPDGTNSLSYSPQTCVGHGT
jgi:hypothetical protein